MEDFLKDVADMTFGFMFVSAVAGLFGNSTFMLVVIVLCFILLLIMNVYSVWNMKEISFLGKIFGSLFLSGMLTVFWVMFPMGLSNFMFCGGLEEVIHNNHAIECEYCGDDERLERHFEHSKSCTICKDEFDDYK